MSKKFAFTIVALVSILMLLVPLTSSAKKRPLCVERTAGRVHVIIGYCP